MKEDHEPGKCYACHKEIQVRWKNLYTIGSEGTWLCMKCELVIVNLLRKMSADATRAKIKHLKEKKRIQMLNNLYHQPDLTDSQYE